MVTSFLIVAFWVSCVFSAGFASAIVLSVWITIEGKKSKDEL